MKTNLFSRLILAVGIIVATLNTATSQVLEVTSGIIPEEMVEILIGSGLTYENVVYTGDSVARGQFWGGPGNIGVSNGIILTSGNVTKAPGPNNTSNASFDCDEPGDDDLTALAGCSTFDACVLEFDFIPEYEYIWFDFVFGSEEYHEYVGQFNDAFGFFISGPGISGPYSNNSENIARIPLSEIPVTINTVNCGNPYNCQMNCTNCQYFVNNGLQFTQYDAFTTVLTAWANVVPMQVYHIKLSVGDGIDHIYDSGVFLQASSFCSGPITGIHTNDQKADEERFNIFPVPARDEINIVSGNGSEFKAELIGQDGKIRNSSTGNSTCIFDISTVPAGLYFLRITDQEGTTVRKIFKN